MTGWMGGLKWIIDTFPVEYKMYCIFFCFFLLYVKCNLHIKFPVIIGQFHTSEIELCTPCVSSVPVKIHALNIQPIRMLYVIDHIPYVWIQVHFMMLYFSRYWIDTVN